MTSRIVISFVVGVAVALGLFFIMHGMISGDHTAKQQSENMNLVDFITLEKDQTTKFKERQTPKKPPPPKEPPPPPDLKVQKEISPQTPQVKMNVPQLDVPFGAGTGPFLGSQGSNYGSQSGQLIPLVRIEPQVPREAQVSGTSGWVVVSFTVMEDGTVEDAEAEDFSARMFVRPALRAISRWKFKPKIVDGKPVKQQATQKIEFQIDKK